MGKILIEDLESIVHEYVGKHPPGKRLCAAAMLLENYYSSIYGGENLLGKIVICKIWADRLTKVYDAVKNLHPLSILLHTELQGHINASYKGEGNCRWTPSVVSSVRRSEKRNGVCYAIPILPRFPRPEWICR
jgi:hypothetical protein